MPRLKGVKTNGRKLRPKSDFENCCHDLKENFDSIVSEQNLQVVGVNEVQQFLENLAQEIKLQIEIIEHRAIIQELRGRSLLAPAISFPAAKTVSSQKRRGRSVKQQQIFPTEEIDAGFSSLEGTKKRRGRPSKKETPTLFDNN